MRWRPGSSCCFPLRRFYCFLAIPRASSFLGIFDRLTIPGAFARPYRVCFVFPSASTPPNISPSPGRFLAVVFLEQGSLGLPFSSAPSGRRSSQNCVSMKRMRCDSPDLLLRTLRLPCRGSWQRSAGPSSVSA